MQFDLLATRSGGAAENMASDFLLLQRYPRTDDIRFRHYGWHRPAFTFGYSQKISFVREQLPTEDPVELCRRPTGGGVVDHRNDWTYALVIPRRHAAFEARAIESYRLVHTCVVEALVAQGISAKLNERDPEPDENSAAVPGPGVCFTRAERYDVIRVDTGEKIAGAAQKRNKHGLLFQGSLARSALGAVLDDEAFHTALCERLASAFEVGMEEATWPEWENDELSQLVDHYASPEWNEFR